MANLTVTALGALSAASQTRIRAELTDGRGDPVVGFSSSGVYIEPTVVTASTSGVSTLSLEPNADIIPLNTYYTITVGSKSFLIEKSAATQTLQEALVTSPLPLAPAYPSDGLISAGLNTAATTPGSVVSKIQVFDANGDSLGYIAVYSSIA
jgi:hypothetical protein